MRCRVILKYMEIREAAHIVANHVNGPKEADAQIWKSWAQYLFKYIMTCVDTDHVGCALTRRRTAGLATMLGRDKVKRQLNVP